MNEGNQHQQLRYAERWLFLRGSKHPQERGVLERLTTKYEYVEVKAGDQEYRGPAVQPSRFEEALHHDES